MVVEPTSEEAGGESEPGTAARPRKPEIDVEDFGALDLRVGRVVSAEPFPEARDPAYKLTVDFGPAVGELRTSAQITDYGLDELVGRMIVGAVNLGTKHIAGFASEFLVLGALTGGGVQLLDVDGRPP